MKFSKVMKFSVMALIGAFVSLCLVLILTPLSIAFYIVTLLSIILMKIKHGNKATKASGFDTRFSMDSDYSQAILQVGFRFSGEMDPGKFRSVVQDRLLNAVDKNGRKRFQRLMQIFCVDFGYYIYKDCENFDLEQHIEVLQLENVVQGALDKERQRNHGSFGAAYVEELKTLKGDNAEMDWGILMKCLMNELGTKHLSAEIPQWQLHLVKENNERYTALFRFHHSIADGVNISRLLCEEFLESPTTLFHSHETPSRLQRFLQSVLSFCLFPFALWKIMKNDDKNVLHGPKLNGKKPVTFKEASIYRRLRTAVGKSPMVAYNKNFYLSKAIPFDSFRSIRKITGAGVYSILFSCLSNSLASHFGRRSTITKEVTTLIPMPLQNLQKPIQLRNKYSHIYLKVPTLPNSGLKDQRGSLDRLRMINSLLQESKEDPTYLSVHSLTLAICSYLPTKIAAFLTPTKGCSIIISNLPGPDNTCYFNGDRIEEVMFWMSAFGCAVSILSYDGKFRVGLSLDEALLKNETEGNMFLHDFENEIDYILQELRQDEAKGSNCENSELLKDSP